jgi:acetyl esterase
MLPACRIGVTVSVDPQLKPLLDLFNSMPQPVWADAAERRALGSPGVDGSLYAQFLLPPDEVAEVWEERIPVAEPPGEITVRIYRSERAKNTKGDSGTGGDRGGGRGALLHLHGGGWWSGGLENVDLRCRSLAAEAGIVVVSVDYRLAPESPYPTALHDARAALAWLVEQAPRLGVDPARIGVGGESAGANLAAALALLVRDQGGPALVFQLLEVPVLDLTLSSPSARTYGEGYVLTTEDLRWCVRQYLGDQDPLDPLASPLYAVDLSGLPPTVIASAECDPVADDGRRYAERLRHAGVPVGFTSYPGLVHGSQMMAGLLPVAHRWQDDVVAAVTAYLGTD